MVVLIFCVFFLCGRAASLSCWYRHCFFFVFVFVACLGVLIDCFCFLSFFFVFCCCVVDLFFFWSRLLLFLLCCVLWLVGLFCGLGQPFLLRVFGFFVLVCLVFFVMGPCWWCCFCGLALFLHIVFTVGTRLWSFFKIS